MSNLDRDDPVQARLARILDAKRRDNADILSALKVAEDAWERLNKEVDTAIGQEFDLTSSELTAVQAALDRLDSPNTEPTDKSFVFAGRVFDAVSKIGLPQMTVRVLREREQTGDPIATAITDGAGTYRAIVPPEQFDPSGEATAIRIEAIAAGGARPVALHRMSIVLTSGGVERVDLPAKQSRAVAGKAAAGEAARDSIEATIETVKQRLKSMQAAHTATARFSDLTRDGLKELSAAMASDPPPIDPGPTPPAPGPGPAPEPPFEPEPQPEPQPQPTSTPLEKIPGVGEKIAAKLREAGIPDCEALVAADFDKVVEILGPELAKRAVAGAKKVLAGGPGPTPEPEPEPEPQPTSTPLEKIPGVGERIAAKLRDAGIPDCEALVAADFDKVVEILGPELAKRAVAGAKRLLAGEPEPASRPRPRSRRSRGSASGSPPSCATPASPTARRSSPPTSTRSSRSSDRSSPSAPWPERSRCSQAGRVRPRNRSPSLSRSRPRPRSRRSRESGRRSPPSCATPASPTARRSSPPTSTRSSRSSDRSSPSEPWPERSRCSQAGRVRPRNRSPSLSRPRPRSRRFRAWGRRSPPSCATPASPTARRWSPPTSTRSSRSSDRSLPSEPWPERSRYSQKAREHVLAAAHDRV